MKGRTSSIRICVGKGLHGIMVSSDDCYAEINNYTNQVTYYTTLLSRRDGRTYKRINMMEKNFIIIHFQILILNLKDINRRHPSKSIEQNH